MRSNKNRSTKIILNNSFEDAMMRAACQRSVSLINSKAKSNTILVSLSLFFFHIADIDLPARCNRTLRIIKLRAPRVPEKKKKKKKPRLSESILARARARKYFNRPLPTISLRSPCPSLAPVSKNTDVCRAGETEPEFTHRRILSKMRSRSIKSREIPRPCHKGIASIRSIPRCVPGSRRFANRSTIPRARLLAFRLFGEES